MDRNVYVTLDQLYRPQPGGIGTYVRGLLQGLLSLTGDDVSVRGIVPGGAVPDDVVRLGVPLSSAILPAKVLTRIWSTVGLGVPRDADIVHATSMAGPFTGGRRRSIHSVGLHDVLWRDEASSSTKAGIKYHEARLRSIIEREELRIFTSSPDLAGRLTAEGVDPARLHRVRLGVDDDCDVASAPNEVSALLAQHGVAGDFTLYAGTREPRKNLPRLVAAHRDARRARSQLGPLVLVGPEGWGDVATSDAISLGVVTRSLLRGLFRDAALVAYVPLAEGWGLPPVEALHAGTRVVVSVNTPSVADNVEVEKVDPLDVASISAGLLRAVDRPNDNDDRQRRRASVAELTWLNCALDHVKGWS